MGVRKREMLERSLFGMEVELSQLDQCTQNLDDLAKTEISDFAKSLIEIAGRLNQIAGTGSDKNVLG